ncbi:MAG: AMP-dependent synthetase, partial [Nitrospinaceae bacterium]|nr:AMP-dependent synthetase [Nitrospinaceae bacterium]
MSAAEVIWRPSEDFLNNSNVARLMKKNGLSGYRELIDWSVADVSRFWEAALDDLGVDWYRPYDRLLDMSEGFAWAKWFVGGEVNIVHNCIDRH